MGELGSDNGTAYPGTLDTRQSFANGPSPEADGSTRMDAEVLNDALKAIIAIETELGTDPAGSTTNVKTRLAVMLAAGGGLLLGTVGAPGLHFTGDTDTGIFSAAGNKITLVAGGIAKLAIDNAVPQTLLSTELDAVSQELLRLQSLRASRADADEVFLSAWMPDDGGQAQEVARMTFILTDASAATVRGRITLSAMDGSADPPSLQELLSIGETNAGALTWGIFGSVAARVTFVQTFSTADLTLIAETAADAAAATATSIAAAAVGSTGDLGATESTGWGASSEANFDLIGTRLDTISTHTTELDLDYEALLVDVASIRTQFALLRDDHVDLMSYVTSVVDALQAHGIAL